jgi:hypothetical protein
MKPGNYVARWIGTVAEGASGSPGFVDVWIGDHRLARREIPAAGIQPDKRQIAELPFTLEREVDRLEYRLWVTGHAPVVLERVELVSTPSTVVSGS